MPVTVSSMSRPSRSSSWVRSRACSSAVRSATVDSRQWWASPVGSFPSRGPVSPSGSTGSSANRPDHGLGVAHVDGEQHGQPFPPATTAGRSNPRSSTGAEWVSAPTDIRSAPAAASAGRRVQVDPAGHLDQRPGRRPPAPGDARGHLVGAHVVEHDHRGAGGHRLGRPGRRGRTPPRPSGRATGARARATASAMDSPPRWLSLTSTASDRLPRWLWPPPARTAAFSSARSPGVVLRVSSTRVAGLAAAHGLDVPPGQRGHARQVAEEVERGPLGGQDRAQRSGDHGHHVARGRPRPRRPSTRPPTPTGSIWANVSSAQARSGDDPRCSADRRPASPPSGRDQRRGEVAQGQQVLGDGPGHRLDHRLAGRVDHGGGLGPPPARPLSPGGVTDRADPVSGPRWCGSLIADPREHHHPVSQIDDAPTPAVGRFRVVAAGVGAAGLAPERGRGQDTPGRRDQVGQLAVGPVGRRARTGGRGHGLQGLPAASSDSALRTTPAPSIMARCSRSRVLATSGQGTAIAEPVRDRHPTAGARPLSVSTDSPPVVEEGGHGAVGSRSVVAGQDRLGQPGTEDHPLQQRVGGQSVGPVDAGAGHLAGGPQAGQRGRPPTGR